MSSAKARLGLPVPRPTGLNLFGLLAVHIGDMIARFIARVYELVDLRVQRLCIPVRCPLNEQRHIERRHGRHGMPVKSLGLDHQPRDSEQNGREERRRMRYRNTCVGQKASKGIGCRDVGS